MNYGEFTGDPNKLKSYIYGSHWKGKKSYKVIMGDDDYNHRFGGYDWTIPNCTNCKTPYHQIFTFDLSDKRLKELCINRKTELPLITCLNCSSCWERQLYKLDFDNKVITYLKNGDTQHWIQEEQNKIFFPLKMYNVKLIELEENENPVDEDTYDFLLDKVKGSSYVCRILGAPLFEQGPIDIECPICKKDMIYVASIFSQYPEDGRHFPDVDFFFGEMSLYYYYCAYCHVMKVECQGT